MTHINSKYKRDGIGVVDFTDTEGRERITVNNPEPHERMPDYKPMKELFLKNLRKGAVKFESMSARRPLVNKTYSREQTFYKPDLMKTYRPQQNKSFLKGFC